MSKMEFLDYYKELQDGRKLELQNLWQRSIMLMTFFVIFFTAYFVFLGNVLSSDKELTCGSFLAVNGVLLFISVCGMITSILYILMGKGSKLWYEKYEASISWVVEGSLVDSNEVKYSDMHAEEECKSDKSKWPDYFPRHGHLSEISDYTDDSIFSSKSGEYSVSKVNIAIGLFGFFFWEAIAFTHLTFFLHLLTKCSRWIISLPAILFLASILWMFASGYLYSVRNKRVIKLQIRKRLKFLNIHDKDLFGPESFSMTAEENSRVAEYLRNGIEGGIGMYHLKRNIHDYQLLRIIDTLTNNLVCKKYREKEQKLHMKRERCCRIILGFIHLIVVILLVVLVVVALVSSPEMRKNSFFYMLLRVSNV